MESRPGLTHPYLSGWPTQAPPSSKGNPEAKMKVWPMVSLVTPSYNQADFLEACIQSVLNQNYPNLEYFVMDGGSIDISKSIIQRYGHNLAGWSSEPDHGQADAINKGWQRSAGKYIWWLNSDDLLLPGSLLTSVLYLERNPDVDMVYGDLLRIDREGRITERYNYPPFDLTKMLLEGLDIPQAGSLIRRTVLDETGMLDPDFHFVMDMEFWQRMGLAGKTIRHLPETLAMFRIYDESKTQSGSERAVTERKIAAERVLSHPNCPEAVKRNRRRLWFSVHVACSRTRMKNGRFKHALGSLLRGAVVYPRGLLQGRIYCTFLLSGLGLFLGWERWAALRRRIRERRRRSS